MCCALNLKYSVSILAVLFSIIPLCFKILGVVMTVSGSIIPVDEWISCIRFQSNLLRAVRHVMARGQLVVVSDGVRQARVGSLGAINYKTMRTGARIDVMVNPLVSDCPWNRAIREAQAILVCP